jgi:hypothetical protein
VHIVVTKANVNFFGEKKEKRLGVQGCEEDKTRVRRRGIRGVSGSPECMEEGKYQ